MLKRHLGAVIVGALVVGCLSYVGAQAMTSQDGVTLTQSEEQPSGPAAGERSRPGHKFGPGLHGALRGDLVVPGPEEGKFQNLRIDRGVVDRVDGSTVVIKEDDGTTVEVTAGEGTRLSRDGEQVTIDKLQSGDHVFTVRIDEGDGQETRAIRAVSPERWARRSEAEPRTGLRDRPRGIGQRTGAQIVV